MKKLLLLLSIPLMLCSCGSNTKKKEKRVEETVVMFLKERFSDSKLIKNDIVWLFYETETETDYYKADYTIYNKDNYVFKFNDITLYAQLDYNSVSIIQYYTLAY